MTLTDNGCIMINLIMTLERIQYNAGLAITGAIGGTSRGKIYKELGLKPPQSRRGLNCFCTFHKIKTTGLPSYLFKINTRYFPLLSDQIS